MMQRRTVRTITWILMFIISTVALEGYDMIIGGKITEIFFEPIRGCF